jgi:7-cyano-7-deazaguanine synthase
VKAFCFSTALDKIQIVAEGIKIGLPFEKLWPCYQADRAWCGRCESCLRFKRALAQNGLSFEQLNRVNRSGRQ